MLRTAALWLLPGLFLLVFYFYPLADITRLSLARAEGAPLSGLISALTSRTAIDVLWFTVAQAVASTLLTLMVGLPGAYLVARYEFPGKSLFRALTGVPFVLPTLVVAAAFTALLGPSGVVNAALMRTFGLTQPPIGFLYTLPAILVAHVFYNTTIVVRMVGDYWANLDPAITGAARVLGASPWQAARRITVPLLAPALAAATLLVFIFNFTSFGVILILGGPRYATLEVEIYRQTVSLLDLPTAAALSLLQLACTLGFTVAYSWLSARVTRPVRLRSRRTTASPLNTVRQKLAASLVVGGLLLLLTAPLGALALRSVTPVRSAREAPTTETVTLRYYRALDDNPRQSIFYAPPSQAVATSLGYAAATMILALTLGVPAAWSLARGGGGVASRLADAAIMLPLGTSAVTLGLGFLVALDRPPVDLRASPILIPLAHTLVAFPFVVRSLTPSLRSIRPRLREAAAVLGASPAQVVRHIDVPLVGRALIVAGTFGFLVSLGEFGATSVISRPDLPTLPVAIYRYLGRPGAMNTGQAMALSTILMGVTLGGMLFMERFRIADVGEF